MGSSSVAPRVPNPLELGSAWGFFSVPADDKGPENPFHRRGAGHTTAAQRSESGETFLSPARVAAEFDCRARINASLRIVMSLHFV
jgi:hypothetical protein